MRVKLNSNIHRYSISLPFDTLKLFNFPRFFLLFVYFLFLGVIHEFTHLFCCWIFNFTVYEFIFTPLEIGIIFDPYSGSFHQLRIILISPLISQYIMLFLTSKKLKKRETLIIGLLCLYGWRYDFIFLLSIS